MNENINKEIINDLINLKMEEIHEKYELHNVYESIIYEANLEIAKNKEINIEDLEDIDQVVLLETLKNDFVNKNNFLKEFSSNIYEDMQLMSGWNIQSKLDKLYNSHEFNSNKDIIEFNKKAVELCHKDFER